MNWAFAVVIAVAALLGLLLPQERAARVAGGVILGAKTGLLFSVWLMILIIPKADLGGLIVIAIGILAGAVSGALAGGWCGWTPDPRGATGIAVYLAGLAIGLGLALLIPLPSGPYGEPSTLVLVGPALLGGGIALAVFRRPISLVTAVAVGGLALVAMIPLVFLGTGLAKKKGAAPKSRAVLRTRSLSTDTTRS